MNRYIIGDFSNYLNTSDFFEGRIALKIAFLQYAGQGYNSYFGFDWSTEIQVAKKNRVLNEFWETYSEQAYEDEENYTIYETWADALKEEALKSTKFRKVIIKYTEDTWYRKPSKEWYNMKSTWFVPKKKFTHVDHLQSRAYIKVLDPYMKVEVDAEFKGNPITFDDILFATRALCTDETRTIDEYKILSYHDGILELEPIIDNYST